MFVLTAEKATIVPKVVAVLPPKLVATLALILMSVHFWHWRGAWAVSDVPQGRLSMRTGR